MFALDFIFTLKLRPPKLVNLKYTNRLQTVSQPHQGWRGVSIQRHRSDGAAGKSTYHYALIGEAARGISRSHIGNSSPGPLRQITALRRPFYTAEDVTVRCKSTTCLLLVRTRPVSSAPVFVVGARPVLGALFTRAISRDMTYFFLVQVHIRYAAPFSYKKIDGRITTVEYERLI